MLDDDLNELLEADLNMEELLDDSDLDAVLSDVLEDEDVKIVDQNSVDGVVANMKKAIEVLQKCTGENGSIVTEDMTEEEKESAVYERQTTIGSKESQTSANLGTFSSVEEITGTVDVQWDTSNMATAQSGISQFFGFSDEDKVDALQNIQGNVLPEEYAETGYYSEEIGGTITYAEDEEGNPVYADTKGVVSDDKAVFGTAYVPGETRMLHYSGDGNLGTNLGDFDYDPSQFEVTTMTVGDNLEGDGENATTTTIPVLRYIGTATDGDAIEIPEGVEVCDYMFAGNSDIQTIPVLPEGVVSAHGMFQNCTRLEGFCEDAHGVNSFGQQISNDLRIGEDEIEMPNSLQDSSSMFSFCSSLRETYSYAGETLWCATGMYSGCKSLETVMDCSNSNYLTEAGTEGIYRDASPYALNYSIEHNTNVSSDFIDFDYNGTTLDADLGSNFAIGNEAAEVAYEWSMYRLANDGRVDSEEPEALLDEGGLAVGEEEIAEASMAEESLGDINLSGVLGYALEFGALKLLGCSTGVSLIATAGINLIGVDTILNKAVELVGEDTKVGKALSSVADYFSGEKSISLGSTADSGDESAEGQLTLSSSSQNWLSSGLVSAMNSSEGIQSYRDFEETCKELGKELVDNDVFLEIGETNADYSLDYSDQMQDTLNKIRDNKTDFTDEELEEMKTEAGDYYMLILQGYSGLNESALSEIETHHKNEDDKMSARAGLENIMASSMTYWFGQIEQAEALGIFTEEQEEQIQEFNYSGIGNFDDYIINRSFEEDEVQVTEEDADEDDMVAGSMISGSSSVADGDADEEEYSDEKSDEEVFVNGTDMTAEEYQKWEENLANALVPEEDKDDEEDEEEYGLFGWRY